MTDEIKQLKLEKKEIIDGIDMSIVPDNIKDLVLSVKETVYNNYNNIINEEKLDKTY